MSEIDWTDEELALANELDEMEVDETRDLGGREVWRVTSHTYQLDGGPGVLTFFEAALELTGRA